jgi:hypothetical protein
MGMRHESADRDVAFRSLWIPSFWRDEQAEQALEAALFTYIPFVEKACWLCIPFFAYSASCMNFWQASGIGLAGLGWVWEGRSSITHSFPWLYLEETVDGLRGLWQQPLFHIWNSVLPPVGDVITVYIIV